MINKKSSNSENSFERHQDLLERFRDSRQTPREFISHCLRRRMVSGADALELMQVLKSRVATRSFALADLSDEQHFRLGLYETTREDSENNPVFVIQFDQELMDQSEDINSLMEDFSRQVAELVSDSQDIEDENAIDVHASREEAMDTILDSISPNAPQH